MTGSTISGWLPPARGSGIAGALLGRCEREIGSRGHTFAGLRVVSCNSKALRFYLAHGWTAIESYPHEVYGIAMTEMRKELGP